MSAVGFVGKYQHSAVVPTSYYIPPSTLLCDPSTYPYTGRANTNICLPRFDGTIKPQKKHNRRTCYECRQIRDQNSEVVKTACSKIHDAEILCKPKNCRRRQNKDGVVEFKEKPILCDPGQIKKRDTKVCTPCPPGTFTPKEKQESKAGLLGQKCEYQGCKCGRYHVTVCCDHPDMIVVSTRSGYKCVYPLTMTAITPTGEIIQPGSNEERHRQTVYGENANSSTGSTNCLSCERKTYMDQNNLTGSESKCQNCSQTQGTHHPPSSQDFYEYEDISEATFLVVLGVIFIGTTTGFLFLVTAPIWFYFKKLWRGLTTSQSTNSRDVKSSLRSNTDSSDEESPLKSDTKSRDEESQLKSDTNSRDEESQLKSDTNNLAVESPLKGDTDSSDEEPLLKSDTNSRDEESPLKSDTNSPDEESLNC